MHVVPSMPARKALMAERSDAFLALLGGFGTFKAVMEILTGASWGYTARAWASCRSDRSAIASGHPELTDRSGRTMGGLSGRN